MVARIARMIMSEEGATRGRTDRRGITGQGLVYEGYEAA